MTTPTSSPTPISIAPHLERLLERKDLTAESAGEIMQAIIDGKVGPASVAALMIALRAKGETAAEIAGFARVMRSCAVTVQAPEGTVDTCGTGGDKSETFNISTATAIVAAGMGVPIAKHGGKSVSSTSGSADVLKELGVNIDAKPACIQECIKSAGIGFMFAPNHHPGMKHVAPVRRELGVRSIFNLLGPLSNPAGAKLQLLGVFDPKLCETFASVLKLMGSQSAMVVCGAGPHSGYLDELSTFGPSTIGRLQNGQVAVETLDASKLGFAKPDSKALYAGGVAQSAQIIREILNGAKGPARDIVVLNAAAAAIVGGKAGEWKSAIALAQKSIDEGRAAAALKKLVEISAKA